MAACAKKSVAVVGAGVAGLATAWRLARRGCAVTLFDRSDIPARTEAASWAAAGMICAHLEMQDAPRPLAAFARAARATWPDFASAIEQASGLPVGYRVPGALHVTLANPTRSRRAGDGVEIVDAEQARALEPMLGPDIAEALWASEEALADPRALCAALAEACRRAGVIMRANAGVSALGTSGGRVTGLRTAEASASFDHIVLAAGAWSTGLLAVAGIAAPRIRPIKGQTLSLALPAGMPAPRRMVWTDDVYIAPQATQRIVIGATQEDIGFEGALDHAGLDALKAHAVAVMPGLAHLPECDRSVGFRPATDDGLPVIGGVGLSNLTLASGQFRNGILFAPLIAEATAQHALENALPALARPFATDRFAEAAA